MQRLTQLHQVADDPFVLGALMALSWVRDGTRSPTDIIRQADLQS
jgi:hypothetical protein